MGPLEQICLSFHTCWLASNCKIPERARGHILNVTQHYSCHTLLVEVVTKIPLSWRGRTQTSSHNRSVDITLWEEHAGRKILFWDHLWKIQLSHLIYIAFPQLGNFLQSLQDPPITPPTPLFFLPAYFSSCIPFCLLYSFLPPLLSFSVLPSFLFFSFRCEPCIGKLLNKWIFEKLDLILS